MSGVTTTSSYGGQATTTVAFLRSLVLAVLMHVTDCFLADVRGY